MKKELCRMRGAEVAKKNIKWVRKSVKQPQSFTKLLRRACVSVRGRVSLAQPPRNSIISKYYAERGAAEWKERGSGSDTQPTAEIKKKVKKRKAEEKRKQEQGATHTAA